MSVERLGTIITDLEQRILHVDDRYVEIVGRERSALIGREALSFTYADDLPTNRHALHRLTLNGPGFTIVKRYIRGDGALAWVKNHVTRVANGVGAPVLCATTQLIDQPFGSESLARSYLAAGRLRCTLAAGRSQLSPEIIWSPAVDVLLCLYRAESEGRSLDVEELVASTSSGPSVMIRWVKLLLERDLVVQEQPGPLGAQSFIRISVTGERKVTDLLAVLAAKNSIDDKGAC